MPQIFRIGAYRVFFWIAEGKPVEPIHVHISKGIPTSNSTKLWITKSGGCIIANNKSQIPIKELNNITEIIGAQSFRIISEMAKIFWCSKILLLGYIYTKY